MMSRVASSDTHTVFETTRLAVRPYTEDDADFVFDMYSRWEVQRFLGTPRPLQNVDEARAEVERWRVVNRSNPLLGVWLVTLRDSGERLGTVMLKMAPLSADAAPQPVSDDYEIGWHVHPDHWGRGYASEASAGTLRRAFHAGIGTVIALVHPDNTPSKRVAAKVRMEYVGRTARYYSMDADLYRASAPASGNHLPG